MLRVLVSTPQQYVLYRVLPICAALHIRFSYHNSYSAPNRPPTHPPLTQLDHYLGLFGSPSPEQLEGLRGLPLFASTNLSSYPSPQVDIATLLPRLNPHGIDFFRRCVDPNPASRISVADAITHPWLAEAMPAHLCEEHMFLFPGPGPIEKLFVKALECHIELQLLHGQGTLPDDADAGVGVGPPPFSPQFPIMMLYPAVGETGPEADAVGEALMPCGPTLPHVADMMPHVPDTPHMHQSTAIPKVATPPRAAHNPHVASSPLVPFV